MNNVSGGLATNTSYEASVKIPVEAGDKLTISNTLLTVVRYALYDLNDKFLKGDIGGTMPISVSDDGYIQFSYTSGDKPMLEKGIVATAYEPYKEILNGVTVEGIDTGSSNNDFKVNFYFATKNLWGFR